MKRLLFLCITILCLQPFKSYGAAQSVREVSSCDRLLASAIGSLLHSDESPSIGDSARVFLSLIGIGMANPGPDASSLLNNLKQLVESNLPENPFLNLSTPLARALANRAETLLPGLAGDWQLIREAILQLHRRGAKEGVERERDRQTTSAVEVPDAWPLNGPSHGAYIGETEKYLFFERMVLLGKSIFGPNPQIVVLGELIRITKENGKVLRYTKRGFRSHGGREAFWFQDGWIFGIASDSVVLPQGWRVYRIDPEFQDNWVASDYTSTEAGIFVRNLRSGEILFFGQRGPADLQTGNPFRLEVSILDPKTMKRNDPHLVIEFPYSEERPSSSLYQAIAESHASPYPWVTITDDLKTDGFNVVRRSESQAWSSLRKGLEVLWRPIDKHGSSNLEVNWNEGQGQRKAILLPFSVSNENEHAGFFEPGGEGPTYIVSLFETPDQVLVDGFPKFQSLKQLWIVDQRTASYKSVQIVDRRPGQLTGHREGRWTTRGEYLIRILSPDKRRIEIWQVDTENAKLFKVLDRSIPCGEDCAIDEVWVDWERKSLIGWSTKEKVFFLRKRNLSREEGHP